MTKQDYHDALIRECEQGKFNLVLVVKGYPSHQDNIAPELGHGMGELILYMIQKMTPRQLLDAFPLKKDFDGKRFGCKDYFYAMEAIKDYGLDRRIEDAARFLWDYYNDDIENFMVSYLCFVSGIYKKRTGGDLAQDAMEHGHIPYSCFTKGGLYVTEYNGESRIEIPYLPAWQGLGLI